MGEYRVRSGQNIYDVAMTLYGSVEGVFDLLTCNGWLTINTPLSYGMILKYHEEFVINKDIVLWFESNNIIVKNGDRTYNYLDIETLIDDHFKAYHPDFVTTLNKMSPDEQDLFWESVYKPKMIIYQSGQISELKFKLRPGTHLVIDWGDYSNPQIFEDSTELDIEHCYKGIGKHIITLYGDFEFELLDFTNINGIYYPLTIVYSDRLITPIKDKNNNHLIVTQ